MTNNQVDEAVKRFQEYLRIPSVQPDVDYKPCVTFIKNQAAELGLPVNVTELVAKKPVVVITWEGTDPQLPSVLLNSHMDVVPVQEEFWTYPPFDAVITPDGYIYGRGTQDMKSIGMMHLESVRRMKAAGKRLKRTVHISFVPDEEIGGADGMAVFSKSEEFKKLNVGFALDESAPNPVPNQIIAFNAERNSRPVRINCRGQPGHGSILFSNTAGEKLRYIIDKFMTLREEEKAKFDAGTWLGEVTTINLTQVNGGVQINVLPEKLSVSFDVRLATHVDKDEFEKMIAQWCKEAGDDVTLEEITKRPINKVTDIKNLKFWKVLEQAVKEMNCGVTCLTCPGSTDARYLRLLDIPAIGFSPLPGCEILMHAHNERILIDVFKRGIDIMEKVVEAIANV